MVGQVKHARAENPLSRAYDATREERAAGEKRGALLCFSFSQRKEENDRSLHLLLSLRKFPKAAV